MIKNELDYNRVTNYIWLIMTIGMCAVIQVVYNQVHVYLAMAFIVELEMVLNIVFIFIPLYGKLFIVQKLNFRLVNIYLGIIASLYIFNIIWVFFVYNVQWHIANQYDGSQWFCHLCINLTLVFIHFSQLLSFYRWCYYINEHSIYLLEANFAAKDLDIIKNQKHV
jgi:hypothetical protein